MNAAPSAPAAPTPPAHVVVIGLGGNLGSPTALLARFRAAAASLAHLGPIAAAPVYRTAAIGGPDQPDYLNSALRLDLRDPAPSPTELLTTLQAIEDQLGRLRPAPRWSARTIDLDLLLFGRQEVELPGPPALTVPHPRLLQRRFALLPTIDLLGPDVMAPGAAVTLGAALAALDASVQPVWPTELRIAHAQA